MGNTDTGTNTNREIPGRNRAVSWLSDNQVIAGIILAVAANFLLLALKPLAKVDPESLPSAHTWVWWATREFLEQKRAPDVVLLGSSLVMHPVSRRDADYLGKDLDYVKHHRSVYMEDMLSARLGLKDTLCYNFALPGGMMSDDYIVARALLKGARKPDVIVLGLSIRDFIDNGVHCAGATPAFRYLKRYTDTDDLLDLSMPQIWQRFDYAVGNLVYLWGKKLDLQVMLSEKLKRALSPRFASIFAASKLNEADPARNMPSNLRSEVEEGMFIVKACQPYSYEDNSGEYRKRYRSANEKTFAIQAAFLDKLMKLAEHENIRVVLFNMPLTPDNHKLMPAGSYQKYLAALNQCSRRWHCPFVDLDAGGKFSLSDFYDTSHMNAGGGKKLIDAIVASMAEQSRIASALGAPDKGHIQVAGRRQTF